MLGDLKSRIKSATPSIRSIRSTNSRQSSFSSKQNMSAPVLSTQPSTSTLSSSSSPSSSLPPPPPPPHQSPSPPEIEEQESNRRKEKKPANGSIHSTTSSQSNKPSSRSRDSCQSIEQAQTNNSSSASSTNSLALPLTPPIMVQKHGRYPSNVSLPSLNSEFFMNHNHLKPGNNAELLSYDKTINLYRENAKRSNDPNIQCDLAIYLYEASKNTQLKPEEKRAYMSEACKILKSLSMRGHSESQYYLANIYASGALSKSGKPGFGNAFPLFVQAAKHQHADAAYRAAKCYEDGLGCLKNKAKAVQYYQLSAKLSHPGAMYRLGLAEINGTLGMKRDIKDGSKWLKRACDAATPEYPHALHEMGLLHEKGLNNIIFKDTAYSIQLYARAAELGYAPSAYRLGECYEFGYLGCKKDAASSIFYYTIAARQGNDDACFALSAWYLAGDEPHIKPSEEKAYYWAKMAAMKGLPKAEFALGYFAENGIGRPANRTEAIDWYSKAAAHGEEQAKKRLAVIKSTPLPHTNHTTTTTTNTNNNAMTIPSSLVAGEAR